MTRQRRPIRVAGEPVTALLPGLFALYDSIVVHDDGRGVSTPPAGTSKRTK